MTIVNHLYCAFRKDIIHYDIGYDIVMENGKPVKEEYVSLLNHAGEENQISVYDFKDLFKFGRY